MRRSQKWKDSINLANRGCKVIKLTIGGVFNRSQPLDRAFPIVAHHMWHNQVEDEEEPKKTSLCNMNSHFSIIHLINTALCSRNYHNIHNLQWKLYKLITRYTLIYFIHSSKNCTMCMLGGCMALGTAPNSCKWQVANVVL